MVKKGCKMVKKGCKKGCKLRQQPKKLTETEKEILHLFTDEFLTEKQIAIRRQTTQQAVNKVKKKLIEKGYMNTNFTKIKEVVKNEPTLQPNNQIRLHGEHYVLNIIWKDKRYKSKIGLIQDIDGHTVKFHNNSIEIYSNVSFFGETPSICDSKALNYWKAFINKLQDRHKIILIKRGAENIYRVRAEYAETNNELASKCLKESQKVRVTGEDGKVWLVVDNSFNFNELETTHPQRSKFDMEAAVQPFFNDLRENPTKLSDIMAAMKKQADINAETAAGLNAVVEFMKSQLPKNNLYDKEEDLGPLDYVG